MASDDNTQHLSGEAAIEKVRGLLEHFRSTMMVTTGAAGEIHVRPMGLQGKASEFDGALWFFVDGRTRAIREIGAGSPVQLVFQSDDDSSYLHLTGTATISQDRAKIEELFTAFMKTWFPEGKDDPNLNLVRFDAVGGSYWASPGGMLQVLAAFTKALVTGKEGKGAEIGDLAL
jgi:general stress protein 26